MLGNRKLNLVGQSKDLGGGAGLAIEVSILSLGQLALSALCLP